MSLFVGNPIKLPLNSSLIILGLRVTVLCGKEGMKECLEYFPPALPMSCSDYKEAPSSTSWVNSRSGYQGDAVGGTDSIW